MTDLQDTAARAAPCMRDHVRWTDMLVVVTASILWSIPFAAVIVAEQARLAGPSVADAMSLLRDNYWVLQGTLASFYVVLLLLLWRVSRRLTPQAWVARFVPITAWYFVPIVCCGVALGVAATSGESYLVSHGVQFHVTRVDELAVPQTLGQLPLALLVMALFAPFVEEFYFRGVVLSWLSRKMPVALAIVSNGLIFGLFHLRFLSQNDLAGWYITGVIALVGGVGATLAMRTRSLWSSFALHAAYNATLISAPMLLPLAGR